MMMKRTRHIMVIALALGTALAMAAPAVAKKPPKDPKPPPGLSGVDASMAADPIWVHEPEDELQYTLTLENSTDADVEFDMVFTAGYADDPEPVLVPGNGTVVLTRTRLAADFPESLSCGVYQSCMLTATAEVFQDGALVADAAAETTLEFYPECDFEQLVGDICIWKPVDELGGPQPGFYKLTLDPTVPGNPNRTTTVLFTVRDHVPGNWCTTPPELGLEPSGAMRIRWRESDGPVVMYVYYPADGVCLSGGNGGDFFAIGNPASLYLVADGTVTAEFLGEYHSSS
jgi:hypothetical protein